MAFLGLLLFSIAFAVTHIGMSAEPVRGQLVDKLGEWGFRGVYSVVSFITLGGAIWLFIGHRGAGPELWTLPWWLYPVPFLLMLIAIPLVVFGYLQPGPSGVIPGSFEIKGIKKITRHPTNMGIAFWGLAHLLANGALGDVAFFGSIFVVGYFGSFHQDMRKTRDLGEPYKAYRKATSAIPFISILKGQNKLEPGDLNKILLGLSLLLYLALIIFHGKLFGEPVF